MKSYPLHAESRTGAHTSNKNSIALDIMLICKKKSLLKNGIYNNKVAKEMEEKSFARTEEKIKRLIKVEAEITIPDIQNIFLSEFFCLCNEYDIEISKINDKIESNLNIYMKELESYFEKYDIASCRTGWWSELYRKKWEV